MGNTVGNCVHKCVNDVFKLNKPTKEKADDEESDSDSFSTSFSASDNGNSDDEQILKKDHTDPDEINEITRKFKRRVLKKKFIDAMYLIEKYAKIDLKNVTFQDGNNVLHYAIKNNNSKMALFLMQHGIDINVVNKKTGNTPLHESVILESVRLTAILLRKKVKLDIKNKYYQTPLDIAIMNNNEELIDLLSNDNVKSFYLNHGSSKNVLYGVNLNDEYKDLFLNEMKVDSPAGSRVNSIDMFSPALTPTFTPKMKHEIPIHGQTTALDNGDNAEFVLDNHFVETTRDRTSATHTTALLSNLRNSKTGVLPSSMSVIDEGNERNEDIEDSIVQKLENKFMLFPSDSDSDDKDEDDPLHKITSLEFVVNEKPDVPGIYQGWVHKRTNGKGFWNKRYLCIKDGFVLWNDKRVRMKEDTVIDSTEFSKWKGHTSLLFLTENGVRIKADKNIFDSVFMFEIDVSAKQNEVRTYQFKVFTKEALRYWIQGFSQHLDALMKEYQW